MIVVKYIELAVEIVGGILLISAFIGPRAFGTILKGLRRASKWAMNSLEDREQPRLLHQYTRDLDKAVDENFVTQLKLGENVEAAASEAGLLVVMILFVYAFATAIRIIVTPFRICKGLLIRNSSYIKESKKDLFDSVMFLAAGTYPFASLLISVPLMIICQVLLWSITGLSRRIFVGVLGLITFTIVELLKYGIIG